MIEIILLDYLEGALKSTPKIRRSDLLFFGLGIPPVKICWKPPW